MSVRRRVPGGSGDVRKHKGAEGDQNDRDHWRRRVWDGSICRAKRSQSHRPTTMPAGTPMTIPMTASTDACQATAEAICLRTKPIDFNRARFAPSLSYGRGQRQPEGDRRAQGQARDQQGGRHPHGAIVHDLGGPLHSQDRDLVAIPLSVRDGGKCSIGQLGDPSRSARPTATTLWPSCGQAPCWAR